MPLSIIIDAPVGDVYNVLNTPQLNDIWNPVTDRVIPDAPNSIECSVESFMGKFRTSKVAVENKSVTITITGNPVLSELKYVLVALSPNQTRVDGTIQLATGAGHYTTIHRTVGEKLLQNLKRYVEHCQSGGTDASFRKEQ